MNTAPAIPMQAPVSAYSSELTRAMAMLAEDPRVLFMGQGVQCPGTFMSTTLTGLPRRLELPVAEEMQMGMAIGLALSGLVPVTIYPRWNFLLLAANQIVNHLDKMQPHVIVRVGVGSQEPLHPGPQHVGDFTDAFRAMMPDTPIIRLENAADVAPRYSEALAREGPTVLVEIADLYAG